MSCFNTLQLPTENMWTESRSTSLALATWSWQEVLVNCAAWGINRGQTPHTREGNLAQPQTLAVSQQRPAWRHPLPLFTMVAEDCEDPIAPQRLQMDERQSGWCSLSATGNSVSSTCWADSAHTGDCTKHSSSIPDFTLIPSWTKIVGMALMNRVIAKVSWFSKEVLFGQLHDLKQRW